MITRTRTTIALTILLAVGITGCAAPAPEPTPTVTPSPESTWHAPAATPDNSLKWEDSAVSLDAATTAMTAFVDHSLPAEAWWEAFEQYLTPEAKYVWLGTDPRNIPATAITGALTIVGESTATRVTISVPTDAGTYELMLTRHVSSGSAPGPWRVFSLTPP